MRSPCKPGNFRALIPFSTSFPIGKGVGLHTITALAEHLSTVTGQGLVHGRQLAKVLSVGARKTEYGRDATLLDDASLKDVLAAAGCSKLRILALYQHQDMRTRMQRLLACHFNQPHLADSMPTTNSFNSAATPRYCCTGPLSCCPTAALAAGAAHSPTPCPDSKPPAPGSWPWSRPSTTPRPGAASGAPPAAGRTAPSARRRSVPSRRSPAAWHVTVSSPSSSFLRPESGARRRRNARPNLA